ncbi:hypothetical protein F5882DRAFT_469237 [Hyaloscypha sp. PMI_1271]|nr:hypothetical protein F5882DRAFT_469237 [Hyaloscypha sp. PMI_1271]
MFRCYRDAAVCYVYLEDLEPDTVIEDALPRCRWFTRGWTLQEFIAPKDVVFYDTVWNRRGTKLAMCEFLSKLTKIPRRVLQMPIFVYQHSVATRMTWAANRKTTRIEDTAYCLLGIFDVNMPLIYGEGIKAFRRLQEEIIKRNADLTIFAWQSTSDHDHILGLFAPSPEPFINGDWNSSEELSAGVVNYTVTNRGLLVSGANSLALATVKLIDGREGIRYFFSLVNTGFGSRKSGIHLRKLGPRIFYRDGHLPPVGWSNNIVGQLLDINTSDFYILSDPINISIFNFESSRYRAGAIHVPEGRHFSLETAVPEDLWDASDRVFLIPQPHSSERYPMVLAMRFTCTFVGASFDLITLCDFSRQEMRRPTCTLFRRGGHARLEALLFNRRNRNEHMYWADLWVEFPEILDLKSDCLIMRIDNKKFVIAVTFQPELVEELLDTSELESIDEGLHPVWSTMGFTISQEGDI